MGELISNLPEKEQKEIKKDLSFLERIIGQGKHDIAALKKAAASPAAKKTAKGVSKYLKERAQAWPEAENYLGSAFGGMSPGPVAQPKKKAQKPDEFGFIGF